MRLLILCVRNFFPACWRTDLSGIGGLFMERDFWCEAGRWFVYYRFLYELKREVVRGGFC